MFSDINIFGYNLDLYNFFNFFGWVVLVIYNYFQLPKKKEILSKISQKIIEKREKNKDKIRTFCALFETMVISCVQFFSGVLLNILWGILTTDAQDNYYGFALWAPFVLILFCILIKVPALRQLDLYTPAYALSLVSFKIACFCAGCCSGIKWEMGMYNPMHGQSEVPVQLIEGAVALGLFIFLHIYNKKKKLIGSSFPMYLILYSGTRFFTEFLRGDFPCLLGPFTTYHFQCLIGIAVGFMELYYVKKRTKMLCRLGTYGETAVLSKKQRDKKMRSGKGI